MESWNAFSSHFNAKVQKIIEIMLVPILNLVTPFSKRKTNSNLNDSNSNLN